MFRNERKCHLVVQSFPIVLDGTAPTYIHAYMRCSTRGIVYRSRTYPQSYCKPDTEARIKTSILSTGAEESNLGKPPVGSADITRRAYTGRGPQPMTPTSLLSTPTKVDARPGHRMVLRGSVIPDG